MPKTKEPLTAKQAAFCQEYLVDLNGKQAAIRAGFSAHTAMQQADQLLNKPHVKVEIQRLFDKRSARLDISADTILREIASVAFANLDDFLTWDGSKVEIKDFKSLEKSQKAAISDLYETTTVSGVNRRIKLHDKLKALELLGRHVKLFTEDLNVNLNPSKPLEKMTDAELAEYQASLLAIENRGRAS